jgi:hypothetical protein
MDALPSALTGNKPNGAASSSKFDPTFTENVIKSMGPKTSPRMREVMTSLIQHVHDFAREVELTVDEWMQGVELLNWAGKMSDDKRNEGQLVCDVIGLESCVSPSKEPFSSVFLPCAVRLRRWKENLGERRGYAVGG